jgi:lysozyme
MTDALGKSRLVALVGAAAATTLVSTVALWEGKRNDPYRDIVGVMTVCYGDTQAPMRRYTDAECEQLLASRLASFAAPVLARNPELKDRPNQLAAAASLSYNVGVAAYQRSTIARLFSARQWRAACNQFLRWNRAGGRVVQGLVRRREYERQICLKGL